MQKNIVFVVMAAGIGSMLEMYDFTIYILLAPVLTKLFFPAQNYTISLMLTLSVFAVGFVVRPFGSVLFGYCGDRFGRKTALMISMVVMGLSAFLIAFIPTYQTIGIVAALLILLLRVLQGFAVGGEFAGALTFIAEHANPKHRGFATAWNVFFIDLGAMLASGSYSVIMKQISSVQFMQWGWRVLFLFGGMVAVIGIFIRKKLTESPLFIKNVEENRVSKNPVKEILTTHRSDLLKAIGMTAGASVFAGVILLFMPTYVTMTTHITLETALFINTISLLFLCCCVPFFGWLSDQLGRKIVALFGAAGLTFFSYPLFLLIQKGDMTSIFTAMIALNFFGAALFGTFGAMLTEISLTESRYSMVALAYNTSFAYATGTAPIVTLFIFHITKNPAAPGFYLTVSALISFVTILAIKQIDNRQLS